MEHELLYRFVFPERPGALMKFLDAFSPKWNITLFHYRSQVYLICDFSFLDQVSYTYSCLDVYGLYICVC